MLFVGSEHPRKNLASVLRALRLLKRASGLRGLKLVKLGAAGRPQAPFRERTRRAIELAGLGEDDVVFCERVAGEEMPAWYAGALCLVLPSLHEGFGMPPLEAMACGCPAVISSDPALVEVAGPAALVVNPHDYRALAEAVETLAFDWPLRRRMVQRGLRHAQGFSWPQAAIETHADRDARRMRARGRRSDPRAKPRRQAQRHRRGDTASDARIVEPTQPRKYILVGFRSAPNAKLHHQLGMKKQLTVAGDTGATPPKVDGIILPRDNKPFPSAVTSAVKSRPSRCTSR